MIFLKAQSLDNASMDHFVLDGEVVSQEDERVIDELAIMSRILKKGYRSSVGFTRVTSCGQFLTIEITTHQRDAIGRPSPIVATLPSSVIEEMSATEVAKQLAGHAELIARTFDEVHVALDLESWWSSPNSGCGPAKHLRRLDMAGTNRKAFSGLLNRFRSIGEGKGWR